MRAARMIGAIVKADFLIRLRRPSTLVVFLLLSALAYVWVPDPSTGRALMVVNNARVSYNSVAIGLATAMLAVLFVGLVGYYVVSNAVARDVSTRCGFVIASTPLRTPEYIAGKCIGNAVFLVVFVTGFMLASMAMVLVRGEAPLQPLVFAKQYLLLTPPIIVFVSVIAIVFESVPLLSGRFGDVAYFFVWILTFALAVAAMEQGAAWAGLIDFSGMVAVLMHVRTAFHTGSFTIGSSPFDATRPVVTLTGTGLDSSLLPSRVVSALLPLPLLLIAFLSFHRFDSARVRAGASKERRGWGERLNALIKPLVQPMTRWPASNAVAADALVTVSIVPLVGLAFAATTVAAIASSYALLGAFPVAAILISDVASRDRRSGTTGLLYAVPRVRERFVWWKFASALLVIIFVLAGPIARMALTSPSSLAALIVAIVFVAAAATALGIITSNPKTFIVLFLSYWYLVVSDRGRTPALDPVGLFGMPPVRVSVAYAVLAITFLAIAETGRRVGES